MCPTCFPRSSLLADASLSSTGSSRASSPTSTVISKRYDFLLPVSPHFVSFVWQYLGCTRDVCSPADECTAWAWSCSPGVSGRDVTEEIAGSPKFLGNLDRPFAMFQTDAGRTACTRPYSAAAWPLVIERQRLPRLGLSTLNSMAFGLAAGTVRSMVGFVMRITPTPRKTHFQLLVRLYRTGFSPARFR